MPLHQTKHTHWGPDLDTTTSCDLFDIKCTVYNVAKAWKRAQQERALGILVYIYGAGKKGLHKRYAPDAKMPEGLRCAFGFQVVRRGNGYVALTRGPMRWTVDRSRPSRESATRWHRYLVGGQTPAYTLAEANKIASDIHIQTGRIVSIETLDR